MNIDNLCNKKVLITAGPTREAIDPVRYISNHSSGKMGYAIAASFLEKGAEVFLVSGPVNLRLQHPKLTIINVDSAADMFMACCRYFETVDIAVFAAAVADYRPEKVAQEKLKKDEAFFTIRMVKNIDIAYEFGKLKTPQQLSVGFALETNDELKHALGKLSRKNFDLVVLNSMKDANACFGHDTNKISILNSGFERKDFRLKSKKDVAEDILNEISGCFSKIAMPAWEESVYDYETMYR